MADEFEMDDLSRLPPKPSKPMRPRSQMFEEPLHIQNDGMDGMDEMDQFGGQGGMDSGIPGFGPPDPMGDMNRPMGGPPMMPMGGMGMGAPMGQQQQPMYMGQQGYAVPSYGGLGEGGPVQKCITCLVVFLILILLIVIIILCIIIIIEVKNTQDDIQNLKLKIKVPTPTPPPFRAG